MNDKKGLDLFGIKPIASAIDSTVKKSLEGIEGFLLLTCKPALGEIGFMLQDIAENPELGKNYEGIKSDLFGLKANRHVIFYRKSEVNPIEITRILHERMDLKKRLME